MRISSFKLAVALVVTSAALGGTAFAAPVDAPTVTGPIAGQPNLISTTFDNAEVGYVYEEYFIEGTATSYEQAKPFKRDGRWKATAADTAPFKTRIVVRRPEKKSDFNGTVFVEWLNVSAGFDAPADWLSGHNQIIRSGAAYIGVSAQSVGVEGRTDESGASTGGIKNGDPARYGTLDHPGDEYSYDIFSQVAVMARGDAGVNPLNGLKVERVIALGESQSAFRMVTYVNAIQPIAGVYDGFLIHSRGAAGAGLGKSLGRGTNDPVMPDTALIRTDTKVPVLTLQTETDLTRLGYLPATQEDSKRVRLWEVAGASHADSYTAREGFGDTGDGATELRMLDPALIGGGPLNCSSPINAAPAYAVLNAALYHVEQWVKDGTPPPTSPRLKATSDPEPAIVRDENGIAKGGIRTPHVDVPIATLDGEPNAGGSFCGLFGNTTPFDAAKIAALYPTHEDYSLAFDESADQAVEDGFLLELDADNMKKAAAQIDLGIPTE